MATQQPKKVTVIGAGPAGLTAAYQLAKAGASVEVHEASNAAGGMSKSLSLWGQRVDLGPHRFFSDNLRVNKLWLEIVKNDYSMVERKTRIFYRNQLFSYPLEPLDAFLKLGGKESIHCALSYLKTRMSSRTHSSISFEDWVVSRFGKRLFEIFFKPYSEKLWGIPCSQLDSDFAAQRIKKLSLWEVLLNALSKGKNNQHKSLVDTFAYPKYGSGMVYERMVKKINETPGCQVKFQSRVSEVIPQKTGNWVISTMPITALLKALPEVPMKVQNAAGHLKFRNTIIIYFLIEGSEIFSDQWLYIQSPELKMGRITNFRNWVPSLYGSSSHTILAAEYWCNSTDALWLQDSPELIETAMLELNATGLLKNRKILGTEVIRIPNCYPVYEINYKEHLKIVTDYLDSIPGLIPIGRYGAFKYNNQDHSILMGILAAEKILTGKKTELWEINTDYNSYQERATITETGLLY